jgi:soluble lytic murein transglycosylase
MHILARAILTLWSVLICLWSVCGLAHAASDEGAGSVVTARVPAPEILSDADVERYQQIFLLQEKADIKGAEKIIAQLDNELLMGHVLSQKYLHPTAWRSSFSELSSWLQLYNDHPAASRIKWLSDRRKPKSAKSARTPKQGYLNGVGQLRPQGFRALIPESYAGRASPRRTAEIARQVRRAIRRGHPSGGLEILDKADSLRYLTKTEEAHLRGELAHAFFIFGVDDKAIRQARYAIAKGGEKAWMGLWAGGLAAWRSKQFDLASSFFVTLVESESAPETLHAGAAFWAHRLALHEGNPKLAATYLQIAGQYHFTFYGVMALQASGQTSNLSFTLPPLDLAFMDWLKGQRGGRRAFGLLQIGNWTEAERELRYLHEECPEDLKLSMITFAAHNHMPSLAFRLADLHRRETGESYLGALYPVLDPIFDYEIDEALVHAIIRKESGFYPLARSRAKAAGLMQLMPATAAFISNDRRYRSSWKHRLHNPHINLKLGQDYIAHLLNEPVVENNLIKLLAAYNGGPGNLNKWTRKIDHDDDIFTLLESLPARETRNYVKGVITYLYIYRLRLGQPAPELQMLLAGRNADSWKHGQQSFLVTEE